MEQVGVDFWASTEIKLLLSMSERAPGRRRRGSLEEALAERLPPPAEAVDQKVTKTYGGVVPGGVSSWQQLRVPKLQAQANS